jgi:hypothetical protein
MARGRKKADRAADDLIDGISYDSYGRMEYHPDFHPNHLVNMNAEEFEYLCYFWEYDSARTMAYALGRTENNLRSSVYKLKQSGRFDMYKQQFTQKLTGG